MLRVALLFLITVGIGATAAINIINRQTEAVIGSQVSDNSLGVRGSFTSGGAVRVNAKNDGFVGAFAVSGSKNLQQFGNGSPRGNGAEKE